MNNRNNGYREDQKPCCYFHPKQLLVGVCPLCLNERLLILAAKQDRHNKIQSSSSLHTTKSSSSIHKIFAFGSLFTRQDWKSDHNCDYDADVASPSPEDSFISIKFEDNGVASWEKSTVSKVSLENCNNKKMSWNHHQSNYKDTTTNKSVIELGKSSRDAFRWRKRIGHVFHLIRWKKGACHVSTGASSKVEGVKVVRKGWIMRTLTKRKKSME